MPSPLPRMVLRALLALLLVMLAWAAVGRLDVVAVAEGKLVPISYVKIVQPADAGIVREIAVTEGQQVQAGQVLARMDANVSQADSKTIQQAMQLKSLELRRIKAELTGNPLTRTPEDDATVFLRVHSEYQSNLRALNDSLSTEQASLERAKHDLQASLEVQRKLEQVLPTYQAQEAAFVELGKQGFAGNLMVSDKQRERVEKEQDLKTQRHTAEGLRSSIVQSEKRMAQIRSGYLQKLEAEQVATFAEFQRLEQEWAKQSHRNSLLELRAPQDGIVKDLVTHTAGTVVQPGAVLMTLVPKNEALQAEVWLKNEDTGFVRPGQAVKLKLAAYPFQKYGMIDAKVLHVGADASEKQPNAQGANDPTAAPQTLTYRTLVQLDKQALSMEGSRLPLTAGMQVSAEVKLADQTVLEYLLSPVRKGFHEAARER